MKLLFVVIVTCRLQGYNTLVVALASRGIALLSSLLDELQVEGLITDAEDEHVPVGADFSVNSPCSAWRRVKKLMHDLPLLNYLLAQFSTLYTMVGLSLQNVRILIRCTHSCKIVVLLVISSLHL